jgi:pimeloyl-ACP methyl ester carboxylesterase
MFDRLRKVFTGPTSENAAGTSANQSGVPATEDKTADLLNQWTSIEISGRRVDLFDPANDEPPSGCVLFLHGHGRIMLNENPVFSSLFRQHNLAAICPDGKRSWWLDRVCSEFDPQQSPHEWLLEEVIPVAEDRWGISSPHVALLGISMGGQGVLQLAYRYARQFPVVAAISPAVDFFQLYGAGLPLDEMFEDQEDARQATIVLNLHPLAWPRYQFYCCDPMDEEWFDGCARLGMKLSSSGIMHERDLDTTAGGHSWDYFNAMAPKAIQHIAESLGKVD